MCSSDLSVRSATLETGTLEDRYEYDVFGQPYKGDLSGGMNMGYTGKPFDTATGLYNYGFRDYRPHSARFTTLDPIRDGNNWYIYVNNDPVNWIDLWGLDTFQIGLTGGIGAGTGYTGSFGLAFGYDRSDPFSLEVGGYFSNGVGSHIGANVNIGIEVATSSNSNIKDLGGNSMTTGFSVNAPTVVNAALSSSTIISLDGAGPGYSASLTTGVGGPYSAHAYVSNTNVYSTTISLNPVIDFFKDLFSNDVKQSSQKDY